MTTRSRTSLTATGLAFAVVAGLSSPAQAEPDPSAELFKANCGMCHTIGEGKLVGPDLRGMEDRHDAEWLFKFIKSSQSMIDAGDEKAVALFKEFGEVKMPDPPISEEEIKSVIAFIRSVNEAGGSFSLAGGAGVSDAPEDIEAGRLMFEGRTRLSGGGPACNACHDVKNDAVIGGGVLAKDLTSVISTMGGAGVQAVLGKPPFPVMEQAYEDHALTEDEIAALAAFLQDADRQQAFQQPRDYGVKLVGSGVIGLIVLLGLYGLIWRGRKRRPVNHDVFARQVQTR